MDNSTVAISKEYLAKLHRLSESEKRSTRAELEWLIRQSTKAFSLDW